MQITRLHKEIDILQNLHGDPSLSSIYGAGCINKPEAMFVFMNPTAKNISAQKNWNGLRAPWLGTKNIWSLLNHLDLVSNGFLNSIKSYKPEEWTIQFSQELYSHLKEKGIYITNLAKCTQLDARPLKNSVFKEYLDLMKKEISRIDPKHIITFGNQVSSIMLDKPVSVSKYRGAEKETLYIENKVYPIYPTYYPVGHGRLHQPLAIKRIKAILK